MSESLSNEQKSVVAQWVAEGASLSDIQARLNTRFSLSLTYMEVRFLIDDLDLVLKDKASSAQPDAASTAALDAAAAQPAPQNAGVTVSIDPVQRPGVALGGSVTFSDGQTAQWSLDAYGQLGFVPPYEGYQPSREDIRQFQEALRKEVNAGGY
jgi:hypothetical protein